ncbi:alpha-2-macroglobulin family protein [Natronohydrobacter thiooxidans]|uniref:alpha-2-macroglobulin family protein n=1 Tax=Natronohydrobacter thiooxidans TaxID=87172 RepID=UPI000A06B192|nr:alpha-2-macroglobulin family protein [Natronohydrobacter thiooxidans]
MFRFHLAGNTLGGGHAPHGAGRKATVAALAFVLALIGTPAAQAQDAPVPPRFATMQENTDFPGGDLTPLFNTTLEQCHATCLRLEECAGFTFNQRNGACFPKSVLGGPSFFEGARSGVMHRVPDADVARARALRAEMGFLDSGDFSDAREQAETMANRYFANGMSEAALLQGHSADQAVMWTGAAVTVADSGAAWLAHARALRVQAQRDGQRRFDLNRASATAALNASLRLAQADARAEALLVMSEAFEASFRGDAALAAMRLADELRPGIDPERLVRLREQYGFRLFSHDVEATSATPRICAQFSEDLSPTRDYAPFVQSAVQGLAVEVEGAQLCVSGVSYGENVSLTLRAGLPAASGDTLVRDVPLEVYIRDRMPLVRFPGRAYVLPASGPRALPVETVNADRLDLALMRVSDRNLVTSIRQGSFATALSQWDAERFENLLAEPFWQGSAQVEGVLNRATTSRLPLDEIGALEPGVYVLRASVPDADPWVTAPAMQWFMVSDLGLTTLSGSDGLHVVVQRLSDGQPAGGLRVALLARSNRVLGEAVSDAQGHVRFAGALTQGTGASAPVMVLVEGGEDMAVLSLDEPEFDLSDRGVEGRAAPGAIDLFLATDRGAYRAGEVIHVTALARDHRAQAIHGLPMIARLMRPDGVEYSRILSQQERAGGHVFALPLGGDVPRGVWRVEMLSDPNAPALASQTVLVEDFLPERVDFDLGLSAEGMIDLSAPPVVQIHARHLFGAPASGLALEGSVTLRAVAQMDGWPGYRFGRHDQRIDPQRRMFERGQVTDSDGALTASLPLERLTLEARPYALNVTATLIDGASRPVERSLTVPVRAESPVIGIRPGFDGTLPENGEASFDLVLVGPDGAALDGTLSWELSKVTTRYQWFSFDGRWDWEPVTERARVDSGEVTLAGGPASLRLPVDWGQYELRVTREGAEFASASVPFAAGWYGAESARDTPDMLSVALDAAEYAPGDVARLRIDTESAGMALVSVLSDRVIHTQLVALSGETVVELPVTDDWGAGAYVTASLIRPSDSAEELPARSMGLVHAGVAPGERALNAVLTAPLEANPRERLEVTLDLPDLTDGPAYATLAAVDLGILTLTGYDAPDPMGYFFGQRQLGVAIRDIYGRLIDARAGAMGQVRSGGDQSVSARAGPAPTEDLLAFFTGPVALENGRAEIGFDLPAFNGTVRLMAVVWSDTGVGQASADVLVRDPVVVQPSLPRFLTPGDTSRMRLELTHATGPAGEMALSVTGHGLGVVPASVTLDEGGRAVIDIDLAPEMVGEHVYSVALTTPDGRVLRRDLRLTVQHTDPEVARSSQFTLATGESFVFSDDALDGLRPGTARAMLIAGAGAPLDVPGLIRRLSLYPYGCTEQIASSIQPLLLASNAVVELGLVSQAEAREQVQEAINRILTRQGRTGSFGLWAAGGYDLWLDAYVTDVLLRAEGQGADVPGPALRMALNNLRNEVAQAGQMFNGGRGYAYALYVLARAGEAAIGDLRYYADTLPEVFDTPLASAQIGAALAAYGDQRRADAMFRQAFDLAADSDGASVWREDYGTPLRDLAGALALAVEAGSATASAAPYAQLVAARGPVDQLSPQEAVWALQAAVASGEQWRGLVRDDQPVNGDVIALYEGVPATIRNEGPIPVTVTVTGFGVPEVPPAAGGAGYTITRNHYTPEGDALDLSGLRVGDRVVTVLEVRPDRGVQGGRLMIDDALPAGFEIDNANLLREGDIRALDWLRTHDSAEMTEARADRFLAAVDWTQEAPLRLAYIARAVSPGSFHHAAAKVEDMYRPTNRALSETGRVVIAP